jgi:F0F1-type ATP synthase delta subunit
LKDIEKEFKKRQKQIEDDQEFYINIIKEKAEELGGYRALSRYIGKGEVYITNVLSRKHLKQLQATVSEIIARQGK